MHTIPLPSEPPPRPALLPLLAVGLWWLATLLSWVLAFPPGVAQTPAWVGTVQSVCFGTGPDGLPAPYGWGALIFGPLGMLAVLLVGWSGELRPLLHWVRRPLGALLLAGMAGAFAFEAGWVTVRVTQAWTPGATFTLAQTPGALPADYPRLERPAPPFALTNQDGDPVHLADLRGRVVLLTFAFGHCAQVCPATMKRLEAVARSLPELSPRVVAITLDAWRDTPATLRGIATRWGLGPRTLLLSGDVRAVNRTLDAYEVARQRDQRTGNINHPPMVYVIDPAGQLAYAFVNPAPRWLQDAVRRVAAPRS